MAYGRLEVSSSAATELIRVFKYQLGMCKLEPNETFHVVTDTGFNPVCAAACMGAGLDMGADTYQLVLPYLRPWSEKALRGSFKGADLIMYLTTHPLHYSEAMREVLAEGKRALCAMAPIHVLTRRTADVDVIRRTKAAAALLEKTRSIRITSSAGTDLVMDKTGRPAVATYGVADEPGHLDFWGGGFFQTAELEGSLEGKLVMDTGDHIFHLGRYVDRPATITFEKGRAVKFEGGVDAFLIQNFLHSYNDKNALMAGHIACGTDPKAIWAAETIQFPVVGGGGGDAESYYGNVQIEIGSNNDILFKGSNSSSAHLGLCMLNCDMYFDGEPILKQGEFVPEDLRKRC